MDKKIFLAMSLPHELKGYVDGKDTISGQNIYILLSCHYKTTTVEVVSTVVGESDFFTDKSKFKPILHHLSDLTKPIEHKGKKFVPIVELAKMCYNNTFNIYPEIKTFEALNSNNEESFGFIGYTEDERFSLTFDNTFNNQSFEFWIDGSEHYIKQFDLFLRLIEWHFDIAGLIEKGEAIDINTLPENPYK